MANWSFLASGQCLIHDRDGKYCLTFQRIIEEAGVQRVPLPRSPDLHAYAERWVKSGKEECLERLILFGDRSLHYQAERPHQCTGNVVLFPVPSQGRKCNSPIQCREQLGGLRRYSHPAAA